MGKMLCENCKTEMSFTKGEGHFCPKCKAESSKKYYWASFIITAKSSLVGQAKRGASTGIMDVHPLIHELRQRKKGIAITYMSWIEIPKDVYDAYMAEMKKDVGKPSILKPVPK